MVDDFTFLKWLPAIERGVVSFLLPLYDVNS